jgi:putative transposase
VVQEALAAHPKARVTRVLQALSISSSSWYRQPVPTDQRRRPGPAPEPIPEVILNSVVEMAVNNPWYGYKRIAVMCRRAGQAVKDRQAYRVMREHRLLQKRRPRQPELYQAAKLFELLPRGPNDLWQMDVTYIHIPGYGWWYAVTVIDYYSRYLLACT